MAACCPQHTLCRRLVSFVTSPVPHHPSPAWQEFWLPDLLPNKSLFPFSQPGPLLSMGHPQISSFFPADHLWSKSQTPALGMPALQLPAEDTKVPGATDAHATDHFQWGLPSEIPSICYLPTEHLGFSGWKNQHSPTRSCFLAVFLSASIQKLARITASAPWSQSSSTTASINGAASNRESL